MKWVKTQFLGHGSYGCVSLAEPAEPLFDSTEFSSPDHPSPVLAVKSSAIEQSSFLVDEGKYVIPFRRRNYMPKSNPNPVVSRKRSHGRTVANNRATITLLAKAAKFEGAVEKVDVDLKDRKKVKCDGGHVKKVTAAVNAKDDLVLLRRNRLGPKPEMVLKEFYAGFSFANSPSPTSLPLPAFFAKKSDPTLVA